MYLYKYNELPGYFDTQTGSLKCVGKGTYKTYKQEKYGSKHMLDCYNNLAYLFTVQKIMGFFF